MGAFQWCWRMSPILGDVATALGHLCPSLREHLGRFQESGLRQKKPLALPNLPLLLGDACVLRPSRRLKPLLSPLRR